MGYLAKFVSAVSSWHVVGCVSEIIMMPDHMTEIDKRRTNDP